MLIGWLAGLPLWISRGPIRESSIIDTYVFGVRNECVKVLRCLAQQEVVRCLLQHPLRIRGQDACTAAAVIAP